MTIEQKIERSLAAFRKTVAHLTPAQQARRIARRERSLRAEAINHLNSKLARDGVDVGFPFGFADGRYSR